MKANRRRCNPGPVSANVTVDWKTIGMVGLVAIVLYKFLKSEAKKGKDELVAAVDITSKTNIASRVSEAINNPGGVRKDPMTGKSASIGSDQFYADHPDMDPSSMVYRYRKDNKGNYVNFDKNGRYLYADKYGVNPPEKSASFWNFATGIGLDGLGEQRRMTTW